MSRTTIRSVSVEPLNIPLLELFTIATGSVVEARNVLITITLDDGSIGYGESAPFPPSTGESQETALAARFTRPLVNHAINRLPTTQVEIADAEI